MQISSLLAGRNSPRAFGQDVVKKEHIEQVLEAARWAPSSGNRQPWRFLIRADRASILEMAPCLSRGNQWALRAPVLLTLLTRAEESGQSNGIPYAFFDCGLAVMSLIVEAESLGLKAHVMAGWNREPLMALLRVPPGFDPVVVIALGHPGDPESLEPGLREKERRPRTRKSLDEIRAFDHFPPEWDGAPES